MAYQPNSVRLLRGFAVQLDIRPHLKGERIHPSILYTTYTSALQRTWSLSQKTRGTPWIGCKFITGNNCTRTHIHTHTFKYYGHVSFCNWDKTKELEGNCQGTGRTLQNYTPTVKARIGTPTLEGRGKWAPQPEKNVLLFSTVPGRHRSRASACQLYNALSTATTGGEQRGQQPLESAVPEHQRRAPQHQTRVRALN